MLASGSSEQPQPQDAPDVPECSRKACRAAAVWQVKWNNPKIHTPARRKIWLACDEHRPWLEHFLQQRLFWRSTEPLGAGSSEEPGAGSSEEPGDADQAGSGPAGEPPS